jgi:hypothetical protein
LTFPDVFDLLRTCEELRARGEMGVELGGEPPSSAVRLHVHVPGQAGLFCTATVRPGAAGRATVSLGRETAEVLARLERAAEALRGLAVTRPARPTTPLGVETPSTAPPGSPPSPTRASPVSPPREPRATMPFVPVSFPPDGVSPAISPGPSGPVPVQGQLTRPTGVDDLGGLFCERPDATPPAHLGALVRRLAATHATGRLRLVGSRIKSFWVVGGQIGLSDAQPPRPEESLGHLVMKMGRLMSSQPIEQAVALARASGRRTGEVLVERGVISPPLLHSALRHQSELRLIEASAWPRADYRFLEGERPEGPMPLCGRRHVLLTLARDVVSRATPAALQARFEAIHGQYGRLRPLADLEEAALLGDHRVATALRHTFAGTHRLRDALGSSPLGKVPTQRLLVLLESYGALETAAEPLVLATGTDPKKALLHRAAQARAQDPFQRLGLHAATAADQIQTAYTRAVAEYGPSGPWARVSPEAASQMLSLAEESYAVLRGSTARKRLRREVLGPDRGRFLADLICAQARTLAKSGQAARVRSLAELALELAEQPDAQALLAGA